MSEIETAKLVEQLRGYLVYATGQKHSHASLTIEQLRILVEAAAALAGLAGEVERLRECITVIEARATGREAAGGTRVDYQDCLRGCGEIARAALQEPPDAT